MVNKLILSEHGPRNLHVELTFYEKYLISIMSFKTTIVVAFNVKEFQRLIRFFECFFRKYTNKAFVTLDLQEFKVSHARLAK